MFCGEEDIILLTKTKVGYGGIRRISNTPCQIAPIKMGAVGFEPTRISPPELESGPLTARAHTLKGYFYFWF